MKEDDVVGGAKACQCRLCAKCVVCFRILIFDVAIRGLQIEYHACISKYTNDAIIS